MTISTRFTKRFGIKHPIVNAPMDPEAGGALASAVAEAGGLGVLGGGYVNRARFEMESAKVTRPDIGCGFITWTIPDDPGLLELALARYPRAMWLSFSDPGALCAAHQESRRAADLPGPHPRTRVPGGRCRS